MRLCLAWRQQETTAEEIETCPAKHLPLQHFQPHDVAFDGAVAPRKCDPGLDCRRVVTEPLREALHSRQCARRRTGEPAIQAIGLAGTHEVSELPRQGDRLREISLWRRELCQVVFVVRPTRRWTPQHEPGGTPRCELAVLRLCDEGQRLPRLSWLGSAALGLTEARRIAGHRGIAPPVALLLEDVKQLQGIVAAPVPVLQHGVFIRVQDAVPVTFVGGALRKRGGPEIAKYGTLGNLELPRNGLTRPALAT